MLIKAFLRNALINIFLKSMLYMTMKNPTPRQLAQYSAAIITGVNLLILFFVKITVGGISWWIIGLTTLLVFAVAYMTIAYTLKRFIYRKIKVIYKTIHRLKRSQNGSSNKLNFKKSHH